MDSVDITSTGIVNWMSALEKLPQLHSVFIKFFVSGKFSVAVLLIAASMIITLIAYLPALVTKHRFSFHRWCDQFLEE